MELVSDILPGPRLPLHFRLVSKHWNDLFFLLTDSIGIVYRAACLPFIKRFDRLQHLRLSTRCELRTSEILSFERSAKRSRSMKTIHIELHSGGSLTLDAIMECDTFTITTVYRQQDLPEDVIVSPLTISSFFGHSLGRVATNDLNVLAQLLKLNTAFDITFWWDPEDTIDGQYMQLEAQGLLASQLTLPLYERATSPATSRSTITLQTSPINSWLQSLAELSQLSNIHTIDCDSLKCPKVFHRHRTYSVIVPLSEYDQISMCDVPNDYIADATPLFESDWKEWRLKVSSVCCRTFLGAPFRIRKQTTKSQGILLGSESRTKTQDVYYRYLRTKLDNVH
jgi:hypothetical protein